MVVSDTCRSLLDLWGARHYELPIRAAYLRLVAIVERLRQECGRRGSDAFTLETSRTASEQRTARGTLDHDSLPTRRARHGPGIRCILVRKRQGVD